MRAQAVVIIPTRGDAEVLKAIASAKDYATVSLVTDKPEFAENLNALGLAGFYTPLPEPVGGNGYSGHRIYAAFSHLVNEPFVFFLDEDDWYEPEHIQSCVDHIEQNGLDWCYSLRRIVRKDGSFVCNDDGESLGQWPSYGGYHVVGTSCYCLRRETAVRLAHNIHGAFGADRALYDALARETRFSCTGRYTVNYRLGGQCLFTDEKYFIQRQVISRQRFPAGMPWAKEPGQPAPATNGHGGWQSGARGPELQLPAWDTKEA